MHAHKTTDQQQIFGGVESRDHRFEDLKHIHNDLVDAMKAIKIKGRNELVAIIDLQHAMSRIANAVNILKACN